MNKPSTTNDLPNLPIGVQDFEKLRNERFFYLDKTALVWKLVSTGCYYFLSRPRRFGKSLLLSTIKAFFEGKHDLFRGLMIEEEMEKANREWAAYPIMYLDLNTNDYKSKSSLDEKLDTFLKKQEELYGRNKSEKSFGPRFEGVIERAAKKTGRRVVILVDEYDKPMLQSIGNKRLQSCYRNTLKGFYGALKSSDAHIQFAMLTGVTKFGKVSVFSDLNHLNDISMDAQFSDICGLTSEELLTHMYPWIERLANKCQLSIEECIDRLRLHYDGYHFLQDAPGIYNPFSVLKTFYKNDFGDYWFETGAPTYLLTLLLKHEFDLERMANAEVTSDVINSVDSDSTNPIPVIYQSGYLTIKEYDNEFGIYTLGFPNKEVETGFVQYLLPYYTVRSNDKIDSPFDIRRFVYEIREGKTEAFLTRLKVLLADTSYRQIRHTESHFQNILWIIFRLCGLYVQAEYHTSNGRIDVVLKTPRYCYVMEFKLNETAQKAMQQIKEKGYALPFSLDGQQIIRVGISFSKKTRTINEWIIE